MNDYFLLQSSGEVWYCKNYIASIFPFSAVDDSKLRRFMNCNKRSHLEFPPLLDILSSGVLHLDNSDVGKNIPSPINSPTTRPLILVRPAEILPHDETNTNELLKRVTSTTTPPNTTWKTSHTIEWDSATCLTYRLLSTHSSRKFTTICPKSLSTFSRTLQKINMFMLNFQLT